MDHRIKEMDGLRGLAVLLVMALHIFNRANIFTQHPTLYMITDITILGWVGVDIFFVLSGFLITSILLKARETKGYFRNFYARRILRIVPLYYATMLVAFLVIIPIKTPEYIKRIPDLIPYQLLYMQNWLSAVKAYVQTTPYVWVTWSLAIEEQFYFLWPAVVYYLKKENLIKFSAAYFIISAVIRAAAVVWSNGRVEVVHFFYYNSFSRFDELIFGGLIAALITIPHWHERIKKNALPAFFLSLSVFGITCIMDLPNLPHPNFTHVPINVAGYPSLTILTAALLAIFVTKPESSPLRTIFRFPPLVSAGKYSYAMYLFHMPVTLILLDLVWRAQQRGWKAYILYIVLTYIVTYLAALVSWNLLEKHMLKLKKYFEYKPA